LNDGFALRQIGLALRIENHFIDLSAVHETRIAISLAGRPISLERKIKDVCKYDEKEDAS
jgi:hypothetical protein